MKTEKKKKETEKHLQRTASFENIGPRLLCLQPKTLDPSVLATCFIESGASQPGSIWSSAIGEPEQSRVDQLMSNQDFLSQSVQQLPSSNSPSVRRNCKKCPSPYNDLPALSPETEPRSASVGRNDFWFVWNRSAHSNSVQRQFGKQVRNGIWIEP